MSIIYNVTIEPVEKENFFQVTWQNVGNNTQDCFTREAEITAEEIRWLWQKPTYQLTIGEKLFRFLDGEARHLLQALKQANSQGEKLQVNLRTCKQTADWPFELLARDGTFLLPHRLHLVRCASNWGKSKNVLPQNRPLKFLFMASSAMDVKPELDFEQEEESIFKITEKLAIDMEVEDSGSLQGLRSHLEREQYDVVYLSGHADIDRDGHPYFIMEDEMGYKQQVFPDKLWNEALIENPPRLLFLSGCRTGEVSDDPENKEAVSFARLLVANYNVPAVLGWGRPVKDKQAIHAAKMLFHELSRGQSILDAVQRARHELLNDFSRDGNPAWPLLRLFSSGMSLNSIIEKGQEWQPKPRRMKYIFLENSQVKVLAEGFVGRRRQMQHSLRTLKQDFDKVGVLFLGIGGLGKSCLAGKICERFAGHTLIIIKGKFNAITLEQALVNAFIVAQDEKGLQILSQKPGMEEVGEKLKLDKTPQAVKDKKTNFMANQLARLCASSFKEKNYLLLLDDFEQNLVGVDKGEPGPLLLEAADLLKVLLQYLHFSGKMTQLIITSRYDFSLSAQSRDLVKERLEKVWLTSFQETEQYKKARELKNIFYYEDRSIRNRLLAAGHGNPRLMEWLDVLVGKMQAVEVSRLLEAVKDRQEDFIREHLVKELLQRGGEELVLFLSWFSIYRRPVLLEGVVKVAEKAGLKREEELLQKGMGLSLIEHDQARRSYQVTPLLQGELLKGVEDNKSCHEEAFSYYKKECEARDSMDPALIEEWIYHALNCGEDDVASSQGFKLVDHLRERLAFREARRVGEWILAGIRRELKTYDDSLLLYKLAYTIDDMGDYRKAIEYYEKALVILKKIPGDKRQDIATNLNDLGVVWSAIKDHRKAMDYYNKALVIDESISGREHPHVARDLNNLGGVWQALGDHRKAVEYYEQALAIWKKVYVKEHPQIATALSNLGVAWNELSDHRKAIDYYEQALFILKNVYGEKHPQIATVLSNLASAWDRMGDHRKAIAYLEQALSIDEEVFGKKHPDVAVRLVALASAWNDFGNYQKAIECHEQALSILKEIYGKKHQDVANAYNNLGAAWLEMGDCHKAIKYSETAFSIWKEIYGDKHQQVAASFNILGSAWRILGDPRKAADYFEQALSIWKETYGEKHIKVGGVLNHLGVALNDLGDHQKAISYTEQALLILKEEYGEKHLQIAVTLNNLGESWRLSKEIEKAMDYYQQALSIWKAIHKENHPQAANTFNNIGLIWDARGEHRKAIKYYEKALTIWMSINGEKHPLVAVVLNNLGFAWRDLCDYRKAIEYLGQALYIEETMLGGEHPKMAIRLTNLGFTYFKMGQKQQAKGCFEKAYGVYNKFFGPEYPYTKAVLEGLKACE